MIDETTLARTLHDLAAGTAVPPDPGTAARARARRIQARRRATAGGLAAVVALGAGLAVGFGPNGPTPRKPVVAGTWTPDTRPTSDTVTLRSVRSGPYTVRTVVYWHGGEFCAALTGAPGPAQARCQGAAAAGRPLGAPVHDQPIAGAIGSARITRVVVETNYGGQLEADIVSGGGFPHRAYALTLLPGIHAVAVVGYDRHGREVARVKADSWAPLWSLGVAEPTSPVVQVRLPGDRPPPGTRRVAYWHRTLVCAALFRTTASLRPVLDWACQDDAQVEGYLIRGAVRALSGMEGMTLATVEPKVDRVVVTLHDGRTLTGVRVTGYGFPRPLMAFAVDQTDIVRIDAYDAGGLHLGTAALSHG